MTRASTIKVLPVREADISKLIKDQLEIYVKLGRLRYFRAHPIRLVTSKGRTFPVPIEVSQKGAPDYFVFLPIQTWFIETKRPGKDLEPEQVAWKCWTERKVCYRHWKINTVREAYELLDSLETEVGWEP